MAETVTLVEVGPRDGLQNEPVQVSTADKIALVDGLSDCGFDRIEVTSFVSPKWVPQMADAAEVMAGIRRKAGVRYGVLTPNMKGLEGALVAGAGEVAVFGSASEGFSHKNINCSVAESLERFEPVIAAARAKGVLVRGYVSCVTDCPYDGPVSPDAVARVAARLYALGCYEVSLGDTIGAGTPERVAQMVRAVASVVPVAGLAGHFHDTHGRALENVLVCLQAGVRVFDAAVGGLGGCPYAPGAAGNVATETLAQMLEEAGFETGVSLARLREMASFAQDLRSGDGGV